MLTSEEIDRVTVVLVRARNPNNIGAAARAMHDFGLRHLRVVNEYAVPFESARSAIDAGEVLANARICASVAEAVADCTLVVGTTAVGERNLQHDLYSLAEAAPRMRSEIQAVSGRVAILFGSEKTGLSNEELSYCNWLLTIPMHEQVELRQPSMNLGQAVAVCLYELMHGDSSEPSLIASSCEPAATAAEQERLTALLAEVLEATGYTRRHPANSDAAQIRRLVRRMAVDANDAAIWMGILRQILWKITGSVAKT